MNGHESITPEPTPVNVPDIEPPEQVQPTPVEHIHCSDYRAHQLHHRRVGSGWRCDIYTPTDVTP
jgi:predicted peptidase